MMKVLLLGDIANRWAVSVERVQELVQIDPLFQGVYYITIKRCFVFRGGYYRI